MHHTRTAVRNVPLLNAQQRLQPAGVKDTVMLDTIHERMLMRLLPCESINQCLSKRIV